MSDPRWVREATERNADPKWMQAVGAAEQLLRLAWREADEDESVRSGQYPRTLEVVSRGGGTLHYKSSDTVLVKGEEEVLSRPQCPHCGLKHLHHDQCGHR